MVKRGWLLALSQQDILLPWGLSSKRVWNEREDGSEKPEAVVSPKQVSRVVQGLGLGG